MTVHGSSSWSLHRERTEHKPKPCCTHLVLYKVLMGPDTQARLRCRRAGSVQFVRCNQQCVQRPLLGGWVTRRCYVPGTRAESRLRAAEKLNESMQAEARDTFAEFEASIGRDSVRHLVRTLDRRPVGFCVHLPTITFDGYCSGILLVCTGILFVCRRTVPQSVAAAMLTWQTLMIHLSGRCN